MTTAKKKRQKIAYCDNMKIILEDIKKAHPDWEEFQKWLDENRDEHILNIFTADFLDVEQENKRLARVKPTTA